MVGQDVTHVIAAACDGRPLGTVVPGWPQPYADMRAAGERNQPAYQRQGASETAVPLEARCEVLDLERIAGLAAQRRFDDRRIRQIPLLAGGEVVELHLIEANGLDRLQQIAEHRVAVETGHAGPDQACPRVEQACIGAVPDDGEIKRLHPRTPGWKPAIISPRLGSIASRRRGTDRPRRRKRPPDAWPGR